MFPSGGTHATIPVSILNLVGSVVICGLSHLEHTRSVRPSTLLCGYLFLSSLLDCAQLRTLYLKGQADPVADVFAANWILRLVLLFVESCSKTAYFKPGYQTLPPESTSGIVNRSLLWWLNRLFSIGSRGIISESDLFELDSSLVSESVCRQMREAWEKRGMIYQHQRSHYSY